ncbi:hypothetical protein [Secundilactobacillus odoratitofui]|nr:hypothetical protein [Secundilactobacillus odoratitofui]
MGLLGSSALSNKAKSVLKLSLSMMVVPVIAGAVLTTTKPVTSHAAATPKAMRGTWYFGGAHHRQTLKVAHYSFSDATGHYTGSQVTAKYSKHKIKVAGYKAKTVKFYRLTTLMGDRQTYAPYKLKMGGHYRNVLLVMPQNVYSHVYTHFKPNKAHYVKVRVY